MKKFISTYIIAFLGYICFFITVLWGGFVVRHSWYLDKLLQNEVRDGGLEFFYWGIAILDIYYIIHLAITFIIFLYLIFEFINRKKLKPLPKFLSNIHIFFIVLGIIFVFIPIYLVAFIWAYQIFP